MNQTLTTKASNLAYTKKIAPLPAQGIQHMGLSKDAALLFHRIGAWYPGAKAMRPGDPTPWIARPTSAWFEELDFSTWEWRKSIAELESKGLIERARGLINNRCLCFIRPSEAIRTAGWLAAGKASFPLISQNQKGCGRAFKEAFGTDSSFLVPKESTLQKGKKEKEDGCAPPALSILPKGFQPKVLAKEASQTSFLAKTSSPIQAPQPPFPSPLVISKPAMAMQVDSAVHPGAQHALAQMAKEGLTAMSSTPSPAKVPKAAPAGAQEAPQALTGVAAMAAGWKATQAAKGSLPSALAGTGGKSPLAILEAVWRAGTTGFTPSWTPKTKMLMKRFIAQMPAKTDASAVMACALADWPAFRAFAKEHYEGWKLTDKPIADVMALQIEAAVNWYMAEAEREVLKAAAAAKAAAAKLATTLKPAEHLPETGPKPKPKPVAEKHVPITPEEIAALPGNAFPSGKVKAVDPWAALKAKKAAQA